MNDNEERVSGNSNERGIKMKYTFYAALFGACAFTLVACGEKKSEETPPPPAPAETTPAPEAAPTPEATPPAPEAMPPAHEEAPPHEATPPAEAPKQ